MLVSGARVGYDGSLALAVRRANKVGQGVQKVPQDRDVVRLKRIFGREDYWWQGKRCDSCTKLIYWEPDKCWDCRRWAFAIQVSMP
jgi:hypothetical protein